MKKFIIASIVTAMALTLAAPVFADGATNSSSSSVKIEIEAGAPSIGGVTDPDDPDDPEDPGQTEPEEGEVPKDKDGNMISITVPTVIPLVFTKDGKTLGPTNFTLKNYDTFGVAIDKVRFVAVPDSGWQIHQVEQDAEPGDYLIGLPKNQKTIEVLVGDMNDEHKTKVSVGDDSAENRIRDLGLKLDGVAEVNGDHNDLTIEFQVVRPQFTEASESSKAFTMYIDFAFAD